MGIILDGKSLAQEIENELSIRVAKLKTLGVVPKLATILVGSDPASATYVKMKANACARVGMTSVKVELPSTTTTADLHSVIMSLNSDPDVYGILLQHPVTAGIDERLCFDAIDITKDVDGVTSLGFGMMSLGLKTFHSATPGGIMVLLKKYNINLSGCNAVVVGRSSILGKPMALMLLNEDCTVTVCHSKTQNLAEIVSRADIIVAAVGRPEFIKGEWCKDGSVIVDAGYHPGGVGDVEFGGDIVNRCFAYTPVPGGVGPMTISTLISQCVESAENKVFNR